MTKLIIDVREPDEYTSGHYKGAVNIPLSTIASSPQVAELDKNQPIVVYCRSGGRSQMAQQILVSKGFTNVTNGVNQESLEKSLG
jgi:phage shock protein E